jgi:hypothetical protein
MSPFGNYKQVIPATTRCRRPGRCAVCRMGPAQLCLAFVEMVGQSWSPAQVDILKKAARSALL